MSEDRSTIEEYAARFEQHLAGTAQERERSKVELVAHLADADDAGELDAALGRLGTPEEAAGTFTPFRSAPPASAPDRFAALLLDQLPLVAVTIAILVNGIAGAISRGQGFAMTFPPFVALEIGDACVSFAPFQCGHEGYQAAGLLSAVGVPAALGWSIVGLALMEARTGTTPGKRRRGLRVVTDAGLRVSPTTAIVRRLSLLAGPFAWLDWVPFLWGEQRRILDLLTGTRVVAVDREEPRAAGRTRGAL
jgi:uncharacterized RDD family membrane protein YckC